MSILRPLAHLQEQLTPEQFAALISSNNTKEVRDFCIQLLTIPAEMTVGGRTYEIVPFLQSSLSGDGMVARAKEMQADLGEEECQHILSFQKDIPRKVKGRVVFYFPGWGKPGEPRYIAAIDGNDDQFGWLHSWYHLGSNMKEIHHSLRLLRRKSVVLPTEMTVGGRVYDILSFGEKIMGDGTMIAVANKMQANLGKEDCQYILEHQTDIPVELRGEVVFVFTDWCDNGCVVCLSWYKGSWTRDWRRLGDKHSRCLRRKV